MTNTKTVLFRVLSIVLSAAIGFALLEGLVRWKIGVPLEQKLPLVRVMADGEAGWRMLPNDQHYTYQHLVQLNSFGFRSFEPQVKAPDEYRILALGGSNLYGQGLADEELMSSVIMAQLNSPSSECRINVINMGARAYGIRSQLAVLQDPGLSFMPDHVALFFYINDFAEVEIEKIYANYSSLDWYYFDLRGKPTASRLRN